VKPSTGPDNVRVAFVVCLGLDVSAAGAWGNHSNRTIALDLPTRRNLLSEQNGGAKWGLVAEWLRRGLQILAPRFDSGRGLHRRLSATTAVPQVLGII
jgi:hypothetical protein